MAQKRGNGQGGLFLRPGREFWYARWTGADGKRKSCCTYTDNKQAANLVLSKKLTEEAKRSHGIIDASQESLSAAANKTIEKHLADFEAMMRSNACTEGHVKRTLLFIREVCAAASFVKASDIKADGVHAVIASMRKKGLAPRTIQGRVVAVKSLTKWLADGNKLHRDPLKNVKRPSVKTDRRRKRRMLLPSEWPYLYAATLASGEQFGMSGTERVALYATAIQTGLRSAELRSLLKSDLFLATDKPYVRCKADNTKNAEMARQYIQADLADQLKQLVKSKMPTASVFALPSEYDMAAMLRGDLAAARKLWLDEVKHDADAVAKRAESDFLAVANHDGEKLDFHSLRHTCGAWLALAGQHLTTIKEVMRHSSIVLTVDTYGHMLEGQHQAAVNAIGAMMAAQKEAMSATGTGGCLETNKTPTCAPTRRSVNPFTITSNGLPSGMAASLPCGKNQGGTENPAEKPKDDVNGPTWTRTRNQGIMSPNENHTTTVTETSCDDKPTEDTNTDTNGTEKEAESTLRLHIESHLAGDIE